MHYFFLLLSLSVCVSLSKTEQMLNDFMRFIESHISSEYGIENVQCRSLHRDDSVFERIVFSLCWCNSTKNSKRDTFIFRSIQGILPSNANGCLCIVHTTLNMEFLWLWMKSKRRLGNALRLSHLFNENKTKITWILTDEIQFAQQ